MENQKIIGGISVERWKRAFAAVAEIAMDQDYFSDILFFDLYPGTHEEAAKVDEDALCNVYNSKWEYADEAFKEVFGIERHSNYEI